MKVQELNKAQFNELKVQYQSQNLTKSVTDEEIINFFAEVDFVRDQFPEICNSLQDDGRISILPEFMKEELQLDPYYSIADDCSSDISLEDSIADYIGEDDFCYECLADGNTYSIHVDPQRINEAIEEVRDIWVGSLVSSCPENESGIYLFRLRDSYEIEDVWVNTTSQTIGLTIYNKKTHQYEDQ